MKVKIEMNLPFEWCAYCNLLCFGDGEVMKVDPFEPVIVGTRQRCIYERLCNTADAARKKWQDKKDMEAK